MYITVLGSRPHAIPSNTELVRNAAGFSGTTLASIVLVSLNSSFSEQ